MLYVKGASSENYNTLFNFSYIILKTERRFEK